METGIFQPTPTVNEIFGVELGGIEF